MEKIDSIIFDLDGTLWSTIDSCVKSLAKVKDKYEEITQDIAADKVMSCMGLSFDAIVDTMDILIKKKLLFMQEKLLIII